MSPDDARLARLCSRKVMIATPIARAPVWQYTVAPAETAMLLQRIGVEFVYAFVVGSSNLPKARNVLASRFLASEADDLVFIDDDMGWKPNDVVRLLASDQPLIAGVGRKKVDKPNADPNVWCAHFLGDGLQQTDVMGNVEVARVGTAFMKISRDVFLRMVSEHPEWKRDGNPEMSPEQRDCYYQFFKFRDEDEGGEDYVFCDRWRDLGGKVFIDPSLELSHVGEMAFTGAILDQMRVEVQEATA